MQEEDARVSSSHSPSTVAGDASFRSACAWSSSSSSSLASDVESDDDDDAAYPQTQCEYEEIPSFRWIASPLRWWKPKKGSVLSRKNTVHARTPIGDMEPGTPGGSKASETDPRLVNFEGCPTFTFDELQRADAEVLGRNTYWTTYKATLGDGRQMVVRRRRSVEAPKDFVTDVNQLGKIRHPNLLAPRAYHYTPDGEKFMVFDYMPKGSLSNFLHSKLPQTAPALLATVFLPILASSTNLDNETSDDLMSYTHVWLVLHVARGNSTPIDWSTKMNIAVGVASGLHHLHTQENMVHGSLSSANVLLDNDLNAKIGGYGLSELLTPAAAISSIMGVMWTLVYKAPELTNLNKANTKTDVYSFGVIMLSLLTGKPSTGFLHKTQLVASITKVETTTQPGFNDTLELALRCVDASPDARPEMQKVLQQLEEIKSRFEKTTQSATTAKGENTPDDTSAAAASNITTASPATEATASPFEIQLPGPYNKLFNDGIMLQARASENTISSPLASSASDSEAMPAPISSCKHKVENLATMTPEGDLIDPEDPNATLGDEVTQNPSVDEELDALNPVQYITGVTTDAEDCRAMSQGTEARSLSSIDWANVDIQAHLLVPTSPPLVSSDPDYGYQRFFRTLYDLAHRSPPLTGNVLEVQLNNMIVGLYSLGYPLDTWVNAASLLLVLAKKKEYIEQYVDDYKMHVEIQLKEFTLAITPAKEDITGTQSEITVLEQKREKLDDTIVKLKDQLALVETQRQEVADSLAAARDVLAVAEGKMESISVRMNCLNQQYSSIPNLRRAMLLELPSLDEIFDSTFQEIMAKTF